MEESRELVAAYRRILRNGPLSRLLLGEFVSSIGDWLYLVALLIIVYQRTQDAVVLGIVGAARILPYVVLSIPAGIVADRFDRRLVLLSTDLARGAVMVVLAFLIGANAPIELIVLLTILATCFSSFFGPAIGAYLPSLVKDESDLGPANTAYAALDSIAFVVGPALAAVILGATSGLAGDGGLVVAFLLNAVSFAFVAAILWRLPSSRGGLASPPATTAEPPPATTPSLRTMRVPLAALLSIDAVGNVVFGGLSVLSVVIAFDLLGTGEQGTGALNAAAGVGGLIGALVSGALVLRRRLAPPLLFGAVLFAASVATLGISRLVPVTLVAMAGATVGSMLMGVVSETLFQRVVPDAIRGRIIGVFETFSVLAFAVGSLVLPALVSVAGIDTVLVTGGVLLLVVAVAAVPLLGHWAIQAPRIDPVRARLSAVAQFSGLSPAALETAERRAQVLSMPAGTAVIRQGEPADRFYVIVEGRVEVRQREPGSAEERLLRTMGPNEYFGEIGLLRRVPRTASVTTLVPTTLLALDQQDFLALVDGAPGLTFPLVDAHRGVVAAAQ